MRVRHNVSTPLNPPYKGLSMKNPSNRFLATVAAGVFGLLVTAASASAQTSLDLIGDKDCFGSGWECIEDGSTWLPGGWSSVQQDADDPSFTDNDRRLFSGAVSWTHTFASDVTSAFLQFRTVGIADIRGPYDVFVDGLLVGSMPRDGFGHILVETFTFALDASILADGVAEVTFNAVSPDVWAIDYSEIIGTREPVTTPEPGTMALFAMGMLGLGVVVRRRRDDAESAA